MSYFELLLLAIGDSMDACAVSMAKGTTTHKPTLRHYLSVGLWFGITHVVVIFLGYFIGSKFAHIVESWDHWISFVLLLLLGIDMIKEALSKEKKYIDTSYSAKNMLALSIAISIDALAVGVSLSFAEVNIFVAALILGVVTLLLSLVGLKIGNIFGNRYKTVAEIIGGVVLIFIGSEILISHLSA